MVINATDYSFLSVPSSVNAPVGSLPAAAFRGEVEENPALHHLCEMLRAERPNGHQNRILTAVHWAGRASAEDANLLRAFVLRCFGRALTDERFKTMSGKKDLDDWFQAAMRGDGKVLARAERDQPPE